MPGVYWLTILPDTKKLKPAIDASMRGVKIKADFGVDEAKAKKAGRDAAQMAEQEANKSKPKIKPTADKTGAKQAGEESGRTVAGAFRSAANGEKLGAEVGGKMASGLKSSLSLIGPMLAGASIFGGLKAAVSEGMDFTTALNTMGGVTRATGEQLQQVSAIARQLGTDVSLPGVSATTAAQAMTELAKGGFSVQESMDAARGTLQLAGAAGIDAASAATIQADALHTFGLSAKDAGYAADVLANVANASTGEITDFAAGLQQSGAVAKQFGLSIDDTAAALGTLANKGIKGSDAGTLIKSALLAITDQGKPAQGAIKELGLTLYDAQGRFVGMGSMMDQLQQAASRMTPEMYQAATNILFGSDAARLAGVAATEGASGFNTLKDAVNKQGGAADMAAAKTKGLPGAWANFQNTLDNVKLSIFDMIQGPLTGLLNKLSAVPDFVSRNSDAFKIAAGVITTVLLPAMAMWAAAQAKSAAISAAAGIGKLVGAWGQLAGVLRISAAAQWLLNAAMTANPIGLVIAGVVAIGAALALFFTKTETGRRIWTTLWNGIKTAASAVWDWMKGALSALGNAISSIWNFIGPAVTAFARFGAAVARLSFAIFMANIRALGQVISWLWQNIAVPAFQGIGNVISVFWSGIQIVWDAFKTAVQWVGDKISWLWQTIAVPAFQAIGGVISGFWNTVKPIWDMLVAAFDKVSEKVGQIKDTFVNAFNKVKEVVSDVWNSIGGIFDKITGGINKAADFISNFGIGGGNAAGGVAGKASGGLIIGPGTGTSDSILGYPAMIRVSNGEYIMNAASTARYLPMLNAMNSGRLPGFAAGGLTPHATEVKSIISRMFGITNIGGYREPDGYNEHSTGNALDVMIPNSQTPQGKALGDAVASWALKNAKALGLTGAIWRQTSYGYGGGFDGTGKAMADRGNPTANHFDHVHLFMNEKPDTSLSLSGATAIGSATSAGGGTYRTATESELSASSNRVDAAQNSVRQAQQSVDDNTYRRDRAQARLDKAKAEGKDTADAQHALDVANRELADANDRLAKSNDRLTKATDDDTELRTKGKLVKDKATSSSSSQSDGSGNDPMGSDFGKMFVSGLLESVGLDGSLFSNPLEWPSVKSAMAGVNYFGKLISGQGASDVGGGYAADAADATGVGDMLSAIPDAVSPTLAPGDINPLVPGAALPATAPGAAAVAPNTGGPKSGAPTVDNSINVNATGMSPAEVATRVKSDFNHRTRTTVQH